VLVMMVMSLVAVFVVVRCLVLFLVVVIVIAVLTVNVLVGMRVAVLLLVAVLMRMRVTVFVFVVLGFVLIVRMRRAFVDAELHALHALPLLTLEVHVEVAEIELREFPFEGGRFHTEIDERADRHVAGNARKAVEEEDFQKG